MIAAGSQHEDLERLDQLESLFESLRSAPLSVVDSLIRDIRSEQSGPKKDLVKVGPWEGYEGMSNASNWIREQHAYLEFLQLMRNMALPFLSFLYESIPGMVVRKVTSMNQSLTMTKMATSRRFCQ